MWMRRPMMALGAALLINRYAKAESLAETEQRVALKVIDFDELISLALAVATKYESEAEQILRRLAKSGNLVPSEALGSISRESAIGIAVAQNNLVKILFSVQKAGKTPNGQIVITRSIVDVVIKSFCPIYPFCD